MSRSDAESEREGAGWGGVQEFLDGHPEVPNIARHRRMPARFDHDIVRTQTVHDYRINREILLRYLESRRLIREPVDYLEFGVFRFRSLNLWRELLEHPDSRLFGFDWFEGLPDDWVHGGGGLRLAKGSLRVGRTAALDLFAERFGHDPRVELVVGRFEDTLEPFLERYRPGPARIVNLDADLYASTIHVLRCIHPFLRSGDLILFDEFQDEANEFRAFDEYLRAYGMKDRLELLVRSNNEFVFRVT